MHYLRPMSEQQDASRELVVRREGHSRAADMLLDGLNWVYGRAVEGGFGLLGAEEAARRHTDSSMDTDLAINRLIRWQAAKAGATGFVTNIGGLITLPVAIPANLTSVLYIQLNMVAAIARLRGHDVQSERVRSLAFVSLVGDSASGVLKEAGVKLGTRLTAQAVARISGETLLRINRAVGFRLLAKAGSTGLVNISKVVPLVGGVVGGGIDGAATLAIGGAAKKLFPAEPRA
jgi:uncharacterized protein (DUF697 family)